MDPGKVIGLAVVLDRQLPVTAHLQRHAGITVARTQHLESAGAGQAHHALAQRGDVLIKRRRIAGQVYKQDTEELGASNRLETMVRVIETGAGVLSHAADVRRRFQVAAQRVRPAVIAAGNHARNVEGLGDELDAAMTADIVEHTQLTATVAGHEQRQAHEFERICTRPRGDRVAEGKGRPACPEHGIPFVMEILGAGVRDIRQAARLSGWRKDAVQSFCADRRGNGDHMSL